MAIEYRIVTIGGEKLDALIAKNEKLTRALGKQHLENQKLEHDFSLLSAGLKNQTADITALTAKNKALESSVHTLSSANKNLSAATHASSAAAKSAISANNLLAASQKTLHGALRGTAGALGGLWLSYGQVIPMITAFVAVSTAVKSVKLGAEFEYMTKYANSISDMQVPLENMRKEILGMKDLAQSPTELAAAYVELQRAGYSSMESLKQLPAVAKYSTVAMQDMKTSVQQLVTMTNAFAKDGLTLETTGDIIAKAANSAATTFGEMQSALRTVVELSPIANFSLIDVAAAAGVLADNSLKGTYGTTALRTGISRMINPTAAVTKVLEKAGVSMAGFVDNNRIMTLRELLVEMNRLKSIMNAEDWAKFEVAAFGIRGLKLTPLIDQIDKFDEKVKGLKDSAGGVSEVFEGLSETAKVSFKNLGDDFERAMIKVFDSKGAVDIINDLRTSVQSQEFANGLATVSKGVIGIGAGMASVTAEYLKLPTWMADAGIISALFFGKGGKIAAVGLYALADAINNIAWAMKQLRNGDMTLMEFISSSSGDLRTQRAEVDRYGEAITTATKNVEKLQSALSHESEAMNPASYRETAKALEKSREALNGLLEARAKLQKTTPGTEAVAKSLNLIPRTTGAVGAPESALEKFMSGGAGNARKYNEMLAMLSRAGLSQQEAEIAEITAREKAHMKEILDVARSTGQSKDNIAKLSAAMQEKLREEVAAINKKYDDQDDATFKAGLAKVAARDAQAKKEAKEYADSLASAADFRRDLAKLKDGSNYNLHQKRGDEIDRQFEDDLAKEAKKLKTSRGMNTALYDELKAESDTMRDYYKQHDIEYLESQEGVYSGVHASILRISQDSKTLGQTISSSLVGAFNASADALTEFVVTGTGNFKTFTTSVLADMARILMREQSLKLFSTLASAAASAFSPSTSASNFSVTSGTSTPYFSPTPSYIGNALGNVFQGPGISAYSNKIVDKPTYFARGGNVMGEAGPEAIMPLKRGPDGKLGVQSSGGGANITLNSNVVVQAGAGGSDSEKEALGKRISAQIKGEWKQFLSDEMRYGGLLFNGGR